LAKYYRELAYLDLQAGNLDLAFTRTQKANILNPQDCEVQILFGLIAEARGSFEEAGSTILKP